MVLIESILPYILLSTTFILELIAFLSSHMIDSRNLNTLHEGIFYRCVYPNKADPNTFNCLWWSADTYSTDNGSLKAVTIFTFLTLFLMGFTIMYSVLSYYYEELRAYKYNASMAIANLINVVLLLLIILIYSFGYARDTKIIPGAHTSLIFSWSYYLLFGALGSNILTIVFFLYNPLRVEKE